MGLVLIKELRYLILGVLIFVYFIYSQNFKENGQDGENQKRQGRKNIKEGEGVKKKIIPI